MLDRRKVVELSKLRGLKPWQEEKRYVQSLVVYSLRATDTVMKGGTYLWLFHSLDRFSDDVDYSATDGLGMNWNQLQRTVTGTLGMFGVRSTAKLVKDDGYTLSFRVDAVGPLYESGHDTCRVYVEISRREKIMLPPTPVKLDEPDYGIPVVFIRGMNLSELAGEKVRAIIKRGMARDVYDLWFLIKRKKVSIYRDIVDKKLGFYGLKFSRERFVSSIEATRSSWEKELRSIVVGELPSPDEILKEVKI